MYFIIQELESWLLKNNKLEFGSSMMVSISKTKGGHYHQHCTVNMGVAFHCSSLYIADFFARFADLS